MTEELRIKQLKEIYLELERLLAMKNVIDRNNLNIEVLKNTNDELFGEAAEYRRRIVKKQKKLRKELKRYDKVINRNNKGINDLKNENYLYPSDLDEQIRKGINTFKCLIEEEEDESII